MTVTRGVLWDSSAILALLDANDADHGRAVQVARQIALARRPSFVTNYIEVEAHAAIKKVGENACPRVATHWRPSRGSSTSGRGGPRPRNHRAAFRQELESL